MKIMRIVFVWFKTIKTKKMCVFVKYNLIEISSPSDAQRKAEKQAAEDAAFRAKLLKTGGVAIALGLAAVLVPLAIKKLRS